MTARRIASDALCLIGIIATLSGIGLFDSRLLIATAGVIALLAGLRLHRGIDR